jgi:proline iminopeptidase
MAVAAEEVDAFVAVTSDGPVVGTARGSGPPLLFLHGGPAISDYVQLIAAELEGWRVISYQQRGLAPSATGGPFTVERHVADAVAVLEAVNAGPVVVVGHSWGGHLALHLALEHPGLVSGLVIVDPLGAVGDGGVAEMGQNLGLRLLPAAVNEYAEVAARLAGPDPTDADMLASLTLLWPGYFADPATGPPIPSFMRASPGPYAETFASVAEHLAAGFAESLRDLRVPAIFVLGASSPMPLPVGEQTAALLPRSEVRVIQGAGHLPWHEQPGCLSAALDRVRELMAAAD